MQTETAIFGAGCFWGVEARFAALSGVLDTAVGYAGGEAETPTYDQVCGGSTGHVEVVQVTYSPARITYSQLLDAFFTMHNPAQPYLKTGANSRDQYRSVIFTSTSEQLREAQERIAALAASGDYPKGLATEVLPAALFWRAEDRHQQYFAKRNIQPT